MKPNIEPGEPGSKRAKRAQFRKPQTVARLRARRAFLAAVDAAPVTDNAANLIRVIERDFAWIAKMMSDNGHSFFNEVYARTWYPAGYFEQLIEECVAAGLVERGVIAGRAAWLPRIPDWWRPC